MPKRAFRVMTTPGGSTETYELFIARVDSRQAKGLHGLAAEHEDIKVVVKRVPALLRMLKAGRIANGPSALALHWFAANQAKFRRG
jgi:ADP-ribose pyrophosphatase